MMTATSDYLARLDEALRDVPHGVAAEIRAGIAEELSSLDPDAARRRIAQLGDPVQIAREAIEAGGYAPPAPPVPPVHVVAPVAVPVTRTRGFAIAAALLLSFGGLLVPFAGWVVGAVMVGMSGMWRTWEKVVAIAVPSTVFVLIMLGGLVPFTVAPVEVVLGEGSSGVEAPNPLLPSAYDLSWSTIIVLAFVAVPASGLWLLWRMRGRTAS